MTEEAHVVWHKHKLKRQDRQKLKKHTSFVLWFTGLPSSGKSTIANELEYALNKALIHTYLLDGDNIRHGLNKDLGFSDEDRAENIRRIGEVAKLFADAGIVVITAFISPYRKDRIAARKLFRKNEFFEIYVRCPVSVCARRDPKGFYKKAISGQIKDFTGVSAAYEEPLNPEIVIDSDILSISESANRIMSYLKEKKIIWLNSPQDG